MDTQNPEQKAAELLASRQSRETDISTAKAEIAAMKNEREVLIRKPGSEPELVDQIADLDNRLQRASIQLERLEAQHRMENIRDIEKSVGLAAELKQLKISRESDASQVREKNRDDWLESEATAAAVTTLMTGFYLRARHPKTGNAKFDSNRPVAETMEHFFEMFIIESNHFSKEIENAEAIAEPLLPEAEETQHIAAINRLAKQAPDKTPPPVNDDYRVPQSEVLKMNAQRRASR